MNHHQIPIKEFGNVEKASKLRSVFKTTNLERNNEIPTKITKKLE